MARTAEMFLLLEALEKPSDAEREAFLEQACADDPGLRQRLVAEGRSTARAFTFERMVGEMAEFLSAR